MDWKGTFLGSVRAAWTSTRIAIRIGIGVGGIVLMSLGLLLIEPYGLLAIGIPLVLVGLACVVRAIF